MPRYEFTEGSSSKFWQIDLKGSSFTTTYGKIGTSGQTSLKEYGDAAAAKKEHDKLVAEKTKKGYALVGKAPPASKATTAKPGKAAAPTKAAAPVKVAKVVAPAKGNPALEKQIDADPDSGDAWTVYADWLQSQGDPRGELAVVQERLATDPKNSAMLSAERKLLKDHRDTIIGSFAQYMCRGGKRDIAGITRKPDLGPDDRSFDDDAAPIRVGWRAGFITSAFVGYPGMDWAPASAKGGDDDDGDGDGGGSEVDYPKLLLEVLSSPATRFLTSLNLGMPNSMEDGVAHFGDVTKKLVTSDALGRLRSLYLGDIVDEECMISAIDLDDLSKLWPKLPKLRSLTIHAGSLKLGAIALPELRELTIISGGLDRKNVAAICAGKFPKLEKLELWFGRKNYGCTVTLKDLRPILDGTGFKSVKHLGLRNSEFADELAAALPGAKIVKQLTALDLSNGTMTAVGAQAMADGKATFAHLRKLDLSNNYLSKCEKVASTIMSQVRTKPQRKDDSRYDGTVYRYAVIGE